MALTLYYLFASFYNPLPWSYCDPEWYPGGQCPGTGNNTNTTTTTTPTSQDVRFLGDDDQQNLNTSWSELYWL